MHNLHSFTRNILTELVPSAKISARWDQNAFEGKCRVHSIFVFGQKSAVIIKQNEDFFVKKIPDSEM